MLLQIPRKFNVDCSLVFAMRIAISHYHGCCPRYLEYEYQAHWRYSLLCLHQLMPVWGLSLSSLLAGEVITVYHILAGILVVGGAWLANKR